MSLDAVRSELARRRLDLLRRETANLREARRILREIETSPDVDARVGAQARRAVELAERAQELGVLDAHRVGASRSQIGAATGLDARTLDEILGRGA